MEVPTPRSCEECCPETLKSSRAADLTRPSKWDKIEKLPQQLATS
jgi:hypothetical protein